MKGARLGVCVRVSKPLQSGDDDVRLGPSRGRVGREWSGEGRLWDGSLAHNAACPTRLDERYFFSGFGFAFLLPSRFEEARRRSIQI